MIVTEESIKVLIQQKLPPEWWNYKTVLWQEILTFIQLNYDEHDVISVYRSDSWKKISGGYSNANYHIDLPSYQLFLQIINHENDEKLPYDKFIRINKQLQQYEHISNYLVPCLFESNNIRLFNWLDEKLIKESLCDNDIFINQMATFLFELHRIDDPSLPKIDIRKHLDNYLLITKDKVLDNEIVELIKDSEKAIQLFNPSVLCHHDLSPLNIFYSDNLHVIDWEYACISDPFFDLAGVCINFNLNYRQKRKFLKSYFKLSSLSYSAEKLEAMEDLYSLLDCLWRL